MTADHAEAPYLDALVEYAARRPGRFHIPGHKGGPAADPAMVEAFGVAVFDLDIPALIHGIDVGDEPTPFQRAQQLASEAWGAKRSWFLLNGASQGNQAICMALRQSGGSVVMQRNVHSSSIDGLILGGLDPVFAAPELDDELGLAHCLTTATLERAFDEAPDAVGAVVLSPTYFGAVADIAALAEVAHARGAPLIVDEAWGAHLRFCELLPRSALEQGADAVISSTHKIVGSLTQSAILHLGEGDRLDEVLVDRAVTLTESTSPSSLLGGSLDAARRQAVVHGDEMLSRTVETLVEVREKVREIPGLDVLDERLAGRKSVAGWDPLRLAVDVRGTGATGHRISELMRELDDVNVELASENVVVAVFGMAEDAAVTSARLLAALRHAAETVGEHEGESRDQFAPPPPWGPLRMAPRDAFLAPHEPVPFDEAVGRIAAESLAAYPPGIPNVLPGELITAETRDYILEALAHGDLVRGAVDRTLRTIRVVAEAAG